MCCGTYSGCAHSSPLQLAGSASPSTDVEQVCQPLQEIQTPPNVPPQGKAATVWDLH